MRKRTRRILIAVCWIQYAPLFGKLIASVLGFLYDCIARLEIIATLILFSLGFMAHLFVLCCCLALLCLFCQKKSKVNSNYMEWKLY